MKMDEKTETERGEERKIVVMNLEGEKVGEVSIRPPQVNEAVLWYYAGWYLASQRSGTHSTKTRSTIRGGGRKPWSQKRTGRARHGSIRAPHWVGGAVTHGPQPKDYSYKLNRKEKIIALKSALSVKMEEENIVLVESFKLSSPKTKEALGVLAKLDVYSGTIVLDNDGSEGYRNTKLAFRNIATIRMCDVQTINAYEILRSDYIMVEKSAFEKLKERVGL